MPVVVVCTVCKQRSKVMEDFVGKPVKCPACGKDFVARPETAAPPPLIKKTGVKSSELKPARKEGSWADLEEAPTRRKPVAAKAGGLFYLWLGLAFLAGAGAGGTGVYFAVSNQASPDPFAGIPNGKTPGPGFDLEKKFTELSKKEEDKKSDSKKEPVENKKGELDKKGDIKVKPGPVETAGGAFLKVKTSHIMAAGFSKDGKELLVCGRDGDLTWYDAQSLTPKRTLPMPAHKKGLDGIAIDRDGKTLLAINFGTLIEQVDAASGERSTVESKIRGNHRGSFISADGTMGITLLDDLIWVWDLSARKLLKKFNPHERQGLALAVALSPDGKLLASSGQVDDSVSLIDTATFKEVGVMERAGGKKTRGANLSACQPAFSPDSKYLAFPSFDNTLIIFHIPSRKERMALKVEAKSTMMSSVSFSQDGNTVALGVGDGTVHLWDVRTGERRAILSMNSKGKADIIDSVRFSPDDKKVLAANRLKEKVFLWDLTRVKLEPVDLAKTIKDPGELVKTGPDPGDGALFTVLQEQERILAAGFSKEGKEVLVCTRGGPLLRIWDIAGKKEKRSLPKPQSGISCAEFDAEGKALLTLNFDSVVEVMDTATGEKTGLENKLKYPLNQAAFSADGKMAAMFLGETVVWDVAGRKLLKQFQPRLSTSAVSLSSDGKLLAAGGQDFDSFEVWDTRAWKNLGTLTPQSGRKDWSGTGFGVPEFSPDSKYLAAPSRSGLIIYHLPSRKQRLELKPESKSEMLLAIAFSNDGNTVGVALGDATVHLWDVRTGERRAILSMGLGKGPYFPNCLRFSLDDKQLLAADPNERKVFVWNLTKVKLEPVDLAKTIKDPTGVAFNPKDPKDPKDLKGTKKPPMGTKEVLKFAGRIDPYLGIALDTDAGSVLTTLPKGWLKQFSYPDFKAQGVYKLGGTAYRPVLDRKKGLLFALVPNPKTKPAPPANKRGGNEIHVYDVKNVLDGKIASGNTLRPAKVIPLNTFASQLLLAPDGTGLFVLDSLDPKKNNLIRLDVGKGERAGELALAENTDCLCLSRDGKKILAGAHVGNRSSTKPKPHQGSIQVIDGETMKLDKSIAIPLDPFYLEAANGGLVFASGGSGLKTEILVIDLTLPDPIAIWQGVAPGSWLRLSDDQKRLFVSNWRSNPALVSGLILPDKMAGSELPSGNSLPIPQLGTRGELTVSPDGQFMIGEAGVIFQLKE